MAGEVELCRTVNLFACLQCCDDVMLVCMACVQVGGVQYTHAQPLICLVCYSVPLQSLTAVPASVHTVRRGGGRADAEESFSSDAEA